MVADTRHLGIGNVFNRIGGPGVLGERGAIEIDSARNFVVGDVFQDGAEANRIVNFRFALPRQMDALGVTAPFNIENTIVAPAMLVVTD